MAKVKIDDELYDRVKQLSEKAGYASADEFVSHMLEREIDNIGGDTEQNDDEVLARLKGLGYIS